jgi:hypothetical protein
MIAIIRASGDCDHDVSIRIATVARYRGAWPRSKISMMIMRSQRVTAQFFTRS